MNKKISVIIPAYNVEKYISKCLNSILEQEFKDYEIIVVDDASVDNTLNILRDYESQYKDVIKIFSQSINHRQGAARNIALKRAAGKYVLFVDSDDYLEKNTFKKLWAKVVEEGSDIIFFNYKVIDQYGRVNYAMHVSPSIVGEMTSEKTKALLTTSVVPWGKLIKKDLIIENQIFFPEDSAYEDQATTYLYYLYAKKTSIVPEYLYIYNLTGESTTTLKDQIYHSQYMNMSLLLVDRIKKRGFEKIFLQEIEYFLFEQMYILGILHILEQNLPNGVEEYLNLLLENLNKFCPNITENKYFIRYTSELYKKIYEAHINEKEKLLKKLDDGYFERYCPNYMKSIDENSEKIKRFFSTKDMCDTGIVLWGAGNYAKSIVHLLRKNNCHIDCVVDKNVTKVGEFYEGYEIKSIDYIKKESLILVPYMSWLPSVIDEMNKHNKYNKIINFEALIKYDIEDPIEDYWKYE